MWWLVHPLHVATFTNDQFRWQNRLHYNSTYRPLNISSVTNPSLSRPKTKRLLKISSCVLSTFFRIYLIVGCISRTACMYIARFLLVLSLHSVSQLIRSLLKWSRGCLGTLKKLVQPKWTMTFFLQFLSWYSDVIEEIPVLFVYLRDTMAQAIKTTGVEDFTQLNF